MRYGWEKKLKAARDRVRSGPELGTDGGGRAWPGGWWG